MTVFAKVLQVLAGGMLLILVALPPIAQAQDRQETCNGVLTQAENLFFNAAFENAINALVRCLPDKSLERLEEAQIYLLLARIYFAKQDEASAAEALEKLFSLDPDYEPDASLPPPFVTFAGHIKEISADNEELDQKLLPETANVEEPKTSDKKWFMIGGGSILAVTAIAIISNGGGSRGPGGGFPEVPAPPGQ